MKPYSAICPRCQARYLHAADNRGWIDIVVCPKHAETDSPNANSNRMDAARRAWRQKHLDAEEGAVRQLVARISPLHLEMLRHVEATNKFPKNTLAIDKDWAKENKLVRRRTNFKLTKRGSRVMAAILEKEERRPSGLERGLIV